MPPKSVKRIPLSPPITLQPASGLEETTFQSKRDENKHTYNGTPSAEGDVIMPIKTFVPAQYHDGKCAYVDYYITHPHSGKLIRKRTKINRIKDPVLRKKYADQLCKKINDNLFRGWNPVLEGMAKNSRASIGAALQYFENHFIPARPDSRRTYISRINQFKSWLVATGLINESSEIFAQHDAQKYLNEASTEHHWSARTYNNNLTLLRTVFNRLRDSAYCTNNPFQQIPKRRQIKGKNREAIPHEIMDIIRKDIMMNDPKFMLAMKILYWCGIRPTELCRIQVHNIRLDHGVVMLYGHQTKNGQEASVTLPDHLLAELATHIHGHRPECYIFAKDTPLTPGRDPLNPRRLAKHWARMRERTGLPKHFKFYSLKDTGTTFLAGIISPLELKNQMRHSSLSITEIYLQRASPKANKNIQGLSGDI